jgi:hypothetical protein
MKRFAVFAIQFVVSCCISCAWADVQSAVKKVERDLSDERVCREEANKLATELPPATLVSDLITMADQPTEFVTHMAANRLILAIDPFPFRELSDCLASETDSYRKSNLLWLLHLGSVKDDQGSQVLSLARLQLDDERPSVRPYERTPSEAREFVMLRVCDVAYNVFVYRTKGEANLKEINSGIDPTIERNRRINQLRETLGLPQKEHAVAPQPSRVVVRTLDKPKMPTPAEERPSVSSSSPNGFWCILLVIILAGGGVLWLALRKLRQK